MKWMGKFIGAFIGIFFRHPIAILLGIFLGHLVDIGFFSKLFSFSTNRIEKKTVFFNSLFSVMGYLSKCDGHVSETEIRIAESVMKEMNLNQAMRQNAIELFNHGKSKDFDLNETLSMFQNACRHAPQFIGAFLEVQFKVVFSNKNVSFEQEQVLKHIFQFFRLHNLYDLYSALYKNTSYGHSSQKKAQSVHEHHLSDAYQLLAVAPTANDADIKKAYRRAMSKNHPDKLMANGLSTEVIKMATVKTQKIKKAYERICQARGIS